MSLIERLHNDYICPRRVRQLCDHLTELIPQNAQVLDVGCGDGLLTALLSQRRPDLQVRGIDIVIRDHTYVPVGAFDGQVLPRGDAMCDVVMFVDVLHHTENPMCLLREAVRVARQAIIIKDHTRNGLFAGTTLRLMDYIGNARFRVALPYNYWPQEQWLAAFETLNLHRSVWKQDLQLYPYPANWVFERSLHFIARLERGRA